MRYKVIVEYKHNGLYKDYRESFSLKPGPIEISEVMDNLISSYEILSINVLEVNPLEEFEDELENYGMSLDEFLEFRKRYEEI